MEIERITPGRVAAAYAKCGMKPAQFVCCKNGECCALSAIAIAEKRKSAQWLDTENYELFLLKMDTLGFDRAYVSSFISGSDWQGLRSFSRNPESRYGFDDGRAAAIRMGLYTPED